LTTETKPKVETPESQGNPPAKAATSEEKKVTAPKTFSEKEMSDQKTIAGRLQKQVDDLTRERDGFKTQAEQAKRESEEAKASVEETKSRLTELEGDLETLTEDNAPAAEIAKMKKRIQATEDQLKKDLKVKQDAADAEKEAARADREQWAGEVNEAREMRLWQNALEVSEDYESGDKDKLKSLCDDRIEVTGKPMSREDVDKLASRLWTKKTAPVIEEEPNLINDSGLNNGGGGVDLSKLSARELFILGQKKKK